MSFSEIITFINLTYNHRSSLRASHAEAFRPRAQEAAHGCCQARDQSRLQQDVAIRCAQTSCRTRLPYRQTSSSQRARP